jgi:N-acetylglucosaminyl-diphospho-decaprenol L-rhamnosyltransferase
MTDDPLAPPGQPPAPVRYGAGLAVLVVGTGAEPFPSTAAPTAACTAIVQVDEPSVILVDSRAPGSPPMAGDLRVLRIGEDVGRGAAVNRAVAALPVDIGLVAVAPPGLVWAEGALDALRAAAVRHPRAGIFAPRVRDPGGAGVASTHPLPRSGHRLGGLVSLVAVLAGRPWPRASPADPTTEEPVGWSSAPGLLLRRAALDSVDGFDPRYPGRLDDLDLADRLATAGWLTVHVPSATVVYAAPPRRDPTAARRYLSDRTPRPVRALLPATSP